MLKTVHITNCLSFGPDTEPFDLMPLNIFVGANASGKSNFLSAIDLMRSSIRDFASVISKGGGIQEWLWKGSSKKTGIKNFDFMNVEAKIEFHLSDLSTKVNNIPISHSIVFSNIKELFHLVDEQIVNTIPNEGERNPYIFYKYNRGNPVINEVTQTPSKVRTLKRETVEPNVSILPQMRDPENYPELNNIATYYEDLKIYRDWCVGSRNAIRSSNPTDSFNNTVREDMSNLWIYINNLILQMKSKREFEKNLKEVNEDINGINFAVFANNLYPYLNELDFSTPAIRLSDGTLRYIALLAILTNPSPPKLLCIEEPEIGLHPDMIHNIADMLLDASHRTQIIVTTHSPLLLDSLTNNYQNVVVCNKIEGSTRLHRLESIDVEPHIDEKGLGELWIQGHFGGNRW